MQTLKKGSQGNDVLTLQKTLKSLGYNINSSGIFDSETYNAVLLFQKANNLAQDGVVGVNTWTALDDTPSPSSNILGIDLSHHNGTVNWNQIPLGQIKFVFCKASQGKTFKDDMMASYMNEAQRLNMLRGIYHFLTFQGVTAKDQVNNFLGCDIDLKQPGILPPVLDVEWQASPSLNQYVKNNQATCIQLIKDWLSGVEAATGRQPMIYTNANFWSEYLGNPTGFENYPLWVASYNNTKPTLPKGWKNYAFWQFSEKGSLPGINGNVDKNYFKGTMKQLNALALK